MRRKKIDHQTARTLQITLSKEHYEQLLVVMEKLSKECGQPYTKTSTFEWFIHHNFYSENVRFEAHRIEDLENALAFERKEKTEISREAEKKIKELTDRVGILEAKILEEASMCHNFLVLQSVMMDLGAIRMVRVPYEAGVKHLEELRKKMKKNSSSLFTPDFEKELDE